MIEWYDYLINGAAMLLSSFGLWFIAIMPGIERWSKNFFQVLFTVLVLLCLTGLAESIAYRYNITVAALFFIMFLETMLLSLPVPMMTVYLLHCCGENIRSSRLFHVIMTLWAVFIIMLASAPFIKDFYYFTPDKQYYRGSWYPVLLMPMLAVKIGRAHV